MRSFFGYDPGGKAANGVAYLAEGDGAWRFQTALVDSVAEAMSWFQERGACPPVAMGIDAFLYWEATPSGWRRSDRWLRERYPSVSNSVLSTNSTSGSMAIQGMTLAMAARRAWPSIDLIETHPKVAYFALRGVKYGWPSGMSEWLFERLGCGFGQSISTEHEWDALLSAWAAREATDGRWTRDLRLLTDEAFEPAGAVRYLWPE